MTNKTNRSSNSVCFLVGFLSYLIDPSSAKCTEPFIAGFDRFQVNTPNDAIAGQLLLTELNCSACHTTGKELKPKGGPSLVGVGDRFHRKWIEEYLRSPSTEKSGGTMPHLLHLVPAKDREDAIQALVAFLSTDSAVEPKIEASGGNPVAHEFWLKGDTTRGQTRYHQIGCIACHAIDEKFQLQKTVQSDLERKIASLNLEADELEEMGLVLPKEIRPVPMSQIASKYNLRSLSMYLIEPQLVRPAGRMPSLKLQPHEAADIATYLIGNTVPLSQVTVTSRRAPKADSDRLLDGDKELIKQGKMYFEKLSCGNCHARSDTKPVMSKPLLDLRVDSPRGCLADDQTGPIFGLSENQKTALRESLDSMRRENVEPKSAIAKREAELSLKMLQVNCYACHERGGRGGVGPKQGPFFENTQQIDIGDEGRMPPSLDHVGRKLQTNWLQKVIEGRGDVRPHFRVRMPVFTDHAKMLAATFAEIDQFQDTTKPKLTEKKEEMTVDLDAGRNLMDSGCVQCHAFRAESLPGTIGIDISNVGNRIHKDWFETFLLNPASLKKNTRMPSFFPDGKSSVPHILDGDVLKQIKSLWGYLNSTDSPLPMKLEQSRSQLFELVPKDAPIILRTFMESNSAGTSAVAVGFPSQYHFGFDAQSMRLAEIWKGQFLNAQGTWYDRFAPPAIPLGTDRIRFPAASYHTRESNNSFAAVETARFRFQGYTLNPQKVPVFRYTVEDTSIEDLIKPNDQKGLIRQIKVASTDPGKRSTNHSIWLLLSNEIVRFDNGIALTKSDLKIQLPPNINQQLVRHDSTSDLYIMLADQETVEVLYQW
jgi:cytochrome c2